ncbi:MAG: cysteine desulfurase [Lachnospiraceae bacterium]|nr:cysteine desulfurase [Lachnospiraceae bacterium]
MIYADNAATTQLDDDAYGLMIEFLRNNYGNASQSYEFGQRSKAILIEARKTIAGCIGADPEEIFFTSCGTESDNWAIKMGALNVEQIITSEIEHHAILNACKAVEATGKTVKYLTVNNKGEVNPNDLIKMIGDKRSLVSVMYANNEIGTIEPIAELARIAHDNGAIFHTDAVQAVGHVPINVHELGIDMMSASGHKFNSPKGIGFLYVKHGVDIKPFFDGGAQENGNRAGTENVASIAAMACALKNNCCNLAENSRHLYTLEKVVIEKLKNSGLGFIRNGSDAHVPGCINLSFAEAEGEMILHRMDIKKICISTGSACDSVNTQISHVIKAIDVPDRYAEGTIRISLGKYNTESEAEEIAAALIEILK